jgi:hypothetical protein
MADCITRAFRFVGNRVFRRRVEAGNERLDRDKGPKDTARLSEDEGPESPDKDSTNTDHTYSRFEELPLDIFVLIIPDLSVVSKACLALTCKAFDGLLRSALNDKNLAWPRYLASLSPCREVSFGSALSLPRNELLLKLQDDRWLYCSSCLKLHPHGHFPSGAYRMPASQRPCIKLPYGGIVDLCACLALTHSDAVRLAEWIETRRPGEDLHQNIRREFRLVDFQVGMLRSKRPVLVHICSATSGPGASLALATMVTLNADSHFVVKTQYVVSWSDPCTDLEHNSAFYPRWYQMPRDTQPIALCPHTKALVLPYGPHPPHLPGLTRRDTCGVCDTKVPVLLVTEDRDHHLIQSERILGPMQTDPTQDFGKGDNYDCWHRALDSVIMIWRTDRRWMDTRRKPRHLHDVVGVMCQCLLNLRQESAMNAIRRIFCPHRT